MATINPDQELETIFPSGRVKPFRFGDFKQVIALLNQYQKVFSGAEDWVQTLLNEGAIDGLAEMALLSVEGLTREELDALPGNEAIDLFFAVAEVNADFFVRSIQSGSNRLAQALNGAGEKSISS